MLSYDVICSAVNFATEICICNAELSKVMVY